MNHAKANYVLQDPEARYLPGDVLTPQQAGQLEGRGGCSIPIDPQIMAVNGAGGLWVRYFGCGLRPGVAPHKLAPVILYAMAQPSLVCWRARISPVDKSKPCMGQVRVVGDSAQLGVQLTGFSAMGGAVAVVDQIGEPDPRGGWTVGGEVPTTPTMGGYLGLCAYGQGDNLRVEWLAVSQVGA